MSKINMPALSEVNANTQFPKIAIPIILNNVFYGEAKGLCSGKVNRYFYSCNILLIIDRVFLNNTDLIN